MELILVFVAFVHCAFRAIEASVFGDPEVSSLDLHDYRGVAWSSKSVAQFPCSGELNGLVKFGWPSCLRLRRFHAMMSFSCCHCADCDIL